MTRQEFLGMVIAAPGAGVRRMVASMGTRDS